MQRSVSVAWDAFSISSDSPASVASVASVASGVDQRFDLSKGVIPNDNQLSSRAKRYYVDIEGYVDSEVAALIAVYYDCYHSMPPMFCLKAYDIGSFKAYSNPDHKWFKPIFLNVLEANPTLREKIASIVITPDDD